MSSLRRIWFACKRQHFIDFIEACMKCSKVKARTWLKISGLSPQMSTIADLRLEMIIKMKSRFRQTLYGALKKGYISSPKGGLSSLYSAAFIARLASTPQKLQIIALHLAWMFSMLDAEGTSSKGAVTSGGDSRPIKVLRLLRLGLFLFFSFGFYFGFSSLLSSPSFPSSFLASSLASSLDSSFFTSS